MPQCSRCLKLYGSNSAGGIHTCTPTQLVRDLESRLSELGAAFDAQSEELRIACEVMTPEQLTEFRHRAYPIVYYRRP